MGMNPVTRLSAALAGVVLALGVAQTSQGAVLLSDNFDADSSSTVLNFNAFLNWTVDSGTVDYLREGNVFGIDCVGPAGGCVDSDGSTGDAGRLVSRNVFSIPSGTTGMLSLMVSGNQRGGASDILNLGILNATTLAPLLLVACPRAPSDPFSDCSLSFTNVGSTPTTVRAFIEGVGNDNIGAVFDNFLFTAVPEPVTLALLGIGLAGLGFSRRSRAAN
jgi:hypothetical protein